MSIASLFSSTTLYRSPFCKQPRILLSLCLSFLPSTVSQRGTHTLPWRKQQKCLKSADRILSSKRPWAFAIDNPKNRGGRTLAQTSRITHIYVKHRIIKRGDEHLLQRIRYLLACTQFCVFAESLDTRLCTYNIAQSCHCLVFLLCSDYANAGLPIPTIEGISLKNSTVTLEKVSFYTALEYLSVIIRHHHADSVLPPGPLLEIQSQLASFFIGQPSARTATFAFVCKKFILLALQKYTHSPERHQLEYMYVG